MTQIMETIPATFRFSIVLLLPPAITLYAAISKKPTIPGMVVSSVVAMILAMIYQGVSLVDGVDAMVHGFTATTGMPLVDTLLTKGGMLNMMDVTLIALCAFAFAGITQKAGMLDVLLQHMTRYANTTGRLIAATSVSSMAVAVMTGSSFLTLLIPGELFAPAFKKMGLAAKNLSRTLEDSGTVIVPIVPWSIAGVYMAGTLGVPTTEYAPFAFLCYLACLRLDLRFHGIRHRSQGPGRRDHSRELMCAMGSLFKAVVAIALPLLVGGLSGMVTARGVQEWYPTLTKPPFNPPSWVFGPVWTLLYLMMGVAAFLVWQKGWGAGSGQSGPDPLRGAAGFERSLVDPVLRDEVARPGLCGDSGPMGRHRRYGGAVLAGLSGGRDAPSAL